MSISPDRNLKEAAPAPPPLGAGTATDRVEAVPTDAPVLSVNNIEVVYDHVILVLKGVSLKVDKGEIVALLGANGAGKSTTLKAISNLLSAERGEVTKGSIVFDGDEVHAPAQRAGATGLHAGDGGAPLPRAPLGRGEPVHRRVHAPRRRRGHPARPRPRLFLFPAAQGAPQLHRRIYFRRRTADVRDRTRADVAAEDDPVGRTFDGARAAAGRGDFRDRRRSQRQGGGVVPARGAEHPHGIEIRALRLCARKRPRGARRRGQGAERERGRQGVLSRRG